MIETAIEVPARLLARGAVSVSNMCALSLRARERERRGHLNNGRLVVNARLRPGISGCPLRFCLEPEGGKPPAQKRGILDGSRHATGAPAPQQRSRRSHGQEPREGGHVRLQQDRNLPCLTIS